MIRPQHQWVAGGSRADRAATVAGLSLPPALLPPIDAHRRLRGPFTAAGTLMRELVPGVLVERPELPGRYDIEILAAAPELEPVMPMARITLTSAAKVRERTRFYGMDRITQLAHGLVEFLNAYLRETDRPASLVIEQLDEADPSDQEWLAIMLRRLDPARLVLVLCGGDGELSPSLAEALQRYSARHRGSATEPAPLTGRDPAELAAEYVAAECIADHPDYRAAYDSLDPAERCRLHDARAEQLASREEISLRLGAIPFHREHGSDPEAAVAAFAFAIEHCSLMGFYHATVEVTGRARPWVDWSRPKVNHLITARRALGLIMTGRATEAEPLYHEARMHTTDPEQHMMAAYSTAMLYTRHLPKDRIDQDKAVGWINQAIAFATTYPDPAYRAFQTVFMQNGLALVETHRGNLAEALRLVEAGSDRLNAELAPDAHLLHRSVLVHNTGQVRAAMGDLEGAITDYTEAIARDPNYAPYYFDRAGLLHKLGRDDEAIADYETTIRMSPPLAEAYYNRGDIRAGRDDLAGALADFSYALELNPGFVAAYLYRAGLYSELGEDAAARQDVDAGLALDPDHPHLLSLRGQLDAAAGDLAAAAEAFDRAVAEDPAIQAAWAGRAALAFERGELDSALADLDRALALEDTAPLRFNRATVLIAAERWDEALADLNRAVELDPTDPDALAERDRCQEALARA
ncbi:MAG TPA: tetratricopeptide repeat protein [Jatrophihabitans sp.]|nr:tetratricopeptide repeat protein [Jatrophihabitans sp.]